MHSLITVALLLQILPSTNLFCQAQENDFENRTFEELNEDTQFCIVSANPLHMYVFEMLLLSTELLTRSVRVHVSIRLICGKLAVR